MSFRDVLDRWLWLVALVALSAVALRLAWGREAFCGGETEHCGREWFSAAGGWFGGIVTAVTILYLARQVRHADRLREDAETMQQRQRINLAKRAGNAAEIAEAAVRRIHAVVSQTEEKPVRERAHILQNAIEFTIKQFRDPAFAELEAITHVSGSWRTIISAYEVILSDVKRIEVDALSFYYVGSPFSGVASKLESMPYIPKYLGEVRAAVLRVTTQVT